MKTNSHSKDEIIKEIAGNMDIGLDSYYNKKTGELLAVVNLDRCHIYGERSEEEEQLLEKMYANIEDYVTFEPLESFESFKILERFADQMSDERFQSKLYVALARRKPFQNFKYLIDNSKYRQDWFSFKDKEMITYVKKNFEFFVEQEEEE